VFQLQYGQPVNFPFVCASNVGVTDEWLLLTDHDDGSKVVHKAKLCRHIPILMYFIRNGRLDNQLDCHVSNLTELDLIVCCNLDFKQLMVDCPQLQRLYITSLRLEDLQVIATCCPDLQGLNLEGLLIPDNADIKFSVKVWEVLGTMKLIYLTVDDLFFEIDKSTKDEKSLLVTLFKQFTTLRALELCSSYSHAYCYKMLSNFPSLEYFRLDCCEQDTCVQDILTTCKKLKYFYCYSCPVQLSLLPVHNNLQQLCISSEDTHLNDNFMDTVSAHGGLIHVTFFVHSVTSKGITTLIKNSPDLLTFVLDEQKKYDDNYFELLRTSLCKKFADRKLFTSGLFYLMQRKLENYDEDDWLQNTDLLSLWPPQPCLITPALPVRSDHRSYK